MVQSRGLFARSRLELAAQLEQTTPSSDSHCGRALACARFIVNLPFLAIYCPVYGLIKRVWGKEAANNGFLAGSTILGDGRDTPPLPFALVYGPWYFFNKLTAGDAEANRVLPRNLYALRPRAFLLYHFTHPAIILYVCMSHVHTHFCCCRIPRT